MAVSLPTHEQFKVLFNPHHPLPRDPQWLIICGLGDNPEAQVAVKKWPNLKVIGIDPDPEVILWQRENGWREKDRLVQVALSDEDGFAKMHLSARGASTLHPQMVATAPPADRRKVRTTTLDLLNSQYGPFLDAIIWIDAEGYDYKIIRGGSHLIASDAVMVVVTEMWTARPDLLRQNGETRKFLHDAGYDMVEIFGADWWGHNEVFLRRG